MVSRGVFSLITRPQLGAQPILSIPKAAKETILAHFWVGVLSETAENFEK